MVGHRLPKKVDNRSQAEKDKERDFLIRNCLDKELLSRLESGTIATPDAFTICHTIATFQRAVNCSRVDGYNINKSEAEYLLSFYMYLNMLDLAVCSPEKVIDFITSNAKLKPRLKRYFWNLVEKGVFREYDIQGTGVRYQITEYGYNYLAHFFWYMVGFHAQNSECRRETFISRMRVDLQKTIRAKPRKRGKALPVSVEAIAA